MKKIILTGAIAILATANILQAQDNNLVINGSFERKENKWSSPFAVKTADSITSSNNTSVDVFNSDCSKASYYHAPDNYMGTQGAKTGYGYAGITVYYADEVGIFRSRPGYQQYSEYVQLKLREPMQAGKAYQVAYNLSLAEYSAYAVSGIGVFFSREKTNVENNSFLEITPHMVVTDVIANKDWTTVTGTYVATGGERYVTLGGFEGYMIKQKIIDSTENNSRKAYYYVDDVSVLPAPAAGEEITSILYGLCYQLDNLNFETDKAVILQESFDELDALGDFLKTYPYIVVYIDGHTDKTGTNQHNQTLSEKRANSVKSYLVNDGVQADRLKVRGYGEALPIDNENEESEANRRVEIVVCGTALTTE